MEAVWGLGEATARDVLEHVNASTDRERAYTTVATTLGRLERKGDLVKRRRGRTDVFHAARDRATWLDARAASAIDDLVEDYGDVALAHFAQRVGDLDPERLAALRRLADDEHGE